MLLFSIGSTGNYQFLSFGKESLSMGPTGWPQCLVGMVTLLFFSCSVHYLTSLHILLHILQRMIQALIVQWIHLCFIIFMTREYSALCSEGHFPCLWTFVDPDTDNNPLFNGVIAWYHSWLRSPNLKKETMLGAAHASSRGHIMATLHLSLPHVEILWRMWLLVASRALSWMGISG